MESTSDIIFEVIKGIAILAFMLAIIGFYQMVKQLLINGSIHESYIITDNNDIKYFLLFIDYETAISGKTGPSSLDTYTLKKIRLQNHSLEYELKLKRFGADFLGGGINVIGINDKYVFLRTSDDDLVVVDHIRGKKLCNRKKIEAKNPGLKGFEAELCKYDDTQKSTMIYDNKKLGYVLNVETIVAEPIKPVVSLKMGSSQKSLKLYDLPSVQLSAYYLGVVEARGQFINSLNNHGSNISCIGGKRFYINVNSDCPVKEWGVESKTFLNPKIMQPENLIDIKYLDTEPRSIIVVHSSDMKPEIGDIYISRVSGISKEEWQLALTAIVDRPRLSEDSFLYFIELYNELCFIYLKGRIISVSTIDKMRGSVISKPTLFVHRQIYSILRMRGFF